MKIGEILATQYDKAFKTIEVEAYKIIKKKIKDSTNDELAGYVRGVVDLQSEIYNILLKNSLEVKEDASK